jgi:hypothetical protein
MLRLASVPAYSSLYVLDERAKLWHDLVPAWIIKKHAWNHGLERL